MAFLSRAERREAQAFARIGYTNPFLPERLELERQILGDRFLSGGTVMHFPSDHKEQAVFKNFGLLMNRCEALVAKMRQGVLTEKCRNEEDQRLYRESVLIVLYGKHFSVRKLPIVRRTRDRSDELSISWGQFKKDYDYYLKLPELVLPSHFIAAHCFSIFYQNDRAFSHIFDFLIGSSTPIAKLRSSI
jgi:hypothetical protein